MSNQPCARPCHACVRDFGIKGTGGMPLNMERMMVCEHCHGKRCPHIYDHRNECTGRTAQDQQAREMAARRKFLAESRIEWLRAVAEFPIRVGSLAVGLRRLTNGSTWTDAEKALAAEYEREIREVYREMFGGELGA